MYRPTDLHLFLKSLGATPRKILSQNFLIDQNILDKIVKAAGIVEGNSVLEIGAGPGALTEALLKSGAILTAVEKDPLFAKALQRFSRLTLFEGDIRAFPFDTLPIKSKVVANIPYQLTSIILGLLLPRYFSISKVVLMVQEEVAKRLVAKASTKDYSALTLFANLYATVNYEFFVSRRCFYPVPKVDSAVVSFTLRQAPIEDPEQFLHFVHTAFASRRKMLRGTLKDYFSREKLEALLEQRGLSKEVRAESCSLEDFLFLYNDYTLWL